MEFIKKMKKREFIEMTLKTVAAILACFLAIILMEGMIYGIELNALKTKSKSTLTNPATTTAYCIEEKDDQYFVIYAYYDEIKDEYIWTANKNELKTEAECKALKGSTVKEVVMHAPNAFKFSITPTHYIIMAVFVLAVGGYFVYRFIKINNTYKQIVDEYNKTGTITF